MIHTPLYWARRTSRGIDQQVAKAAKAAAALGSIKRNRLIALDGTTRASTVSWRPGAPPEIKGYVTCPDGMPVIPEFVIGSYRLARSTLTCDKSGVPDLLGGAVQLDFIAEPAVRFVVVIQYVCECTA